MIDTLQPSHVGYEILKNNPMTRSRMAKLTRQARQNEGRVGQNDLLYIGLHLLNFSYEQKREGYHYLRYLWNETRHKLSKKTYQDIYAVVERPLYYKSQITMLSILRIMEFSEKYSHIASNLDRHDISHLRRSFFDLFPLNYVWYITSIVASIDIKSLEHLATVLHKCSQRIDQDGMWRLYSIGLRVNNTTQDLQLSSCPLSDKISKIKSDYVSYFVEHQIPDHYDNCDKQIALFNAQFEQNKDLFSNDMMIRHFLLEIGKLLLNVEKLTAEKL